MSSSRTRGSIGVGGKIKIFFYSLFCILYFVFPHFASALGCCQIHEAGAGQLSFGSDRCETDKNACDEVKAGTRSGGVSVAWGEYNTCSNAKTCSAAAESAGVLAAQTAETAAVEEDLKVTFRPEVSIPFSDTIVRGKEIPIDGLTVARYVKSVYDFFIAMAGFTAVIFVMIGGFQWATSNGNQKEIAEAKSKISRSLLGMMALFSTYQALNVLGGNLTEFKTLNIYQVKSEFLPTTFTSADLAETDLPDGIYAASPVPLYSQRDFSNAYGTSCLNDRGQQATIADSGCGPTSMAMVASYLTGKGVSPVSMANDFVAGGYRTCGKGTSGNAFTDKTILNSLGLKGVEIAQGSIFSYLSQKKPVIVSVGPSVFTGSGHYIVLAGIDDATRSVIVNDPFRKCYKVTADTASFMSKPVGQRDCRNTFPWEYINKVIKFGKGYLLTK